MGRQEKLSFINSYFSSFIDTFKESSEVCKQSIFDIVKDLKEIKPKSKIVFFGNGASNTIANHAVLDFINLTGIKCVSLNDIGLITGWSNDYGYDTIVERYVEKQMHSDDILFLISSSGESKNVIKGCRAANNKGIKSVTLTGFNSNNTLSKLGTINLWVNSMDYNIVESIHNFWIVSIAEYYKKVMYG